MIRCFFGIDSFLLPVLTAIRVFERTQPVLILVLAIPWTVSLVVFVLCISSFVNLRNPVVMSLILFGGQDTVSHPSVLVIFLLCSIFMLLLFRIIQYLSILFCSLLFLNLVSLVRLCGGCVFFLVTTVSPVQLFGHCHFDDLTLFVLFNFATLFIGFQRCGQVQIFGRLSFGMFTFFVLSWSVTFLATICDRLLSFLEKSGPRLYLSLARRADCALGWDLCSKILH